MAKTTIHMVPEKDGEDPFCIVIMTGDIVTEHWTVPQTEALRKKLSKHMLRLVHTLMIENIGLKNAAKGKPDTPAIIQGPSEPAN